MLAFVLVLVLVVLASVLAPVPTTVSPAYFVFRPLPPALQLLQ